jgi:hypothetical protein
VLCDRKVADRVRRNAEESAQREAEEVAARAAAAEAVRNALEQAWREAARQEQRDEAAARLLTEAVARMANANARRELDSRRAAEAEAEAQAKLVVVAAVAANVVVEAAVAAAGEAGVKAEAGSPFNFYSSGFDEMPTKRDLYSSGGFDDLPAPPDEPPPEPPSVSGAPSQLEHEPEASAAQAAVAADGVAVASITSEAEVAVAPEEPVATAREWPPARQGLQGAISKRSDWLRAWNVRNVSLQPASGSGAGLLAWGSGDAQSGMLPLDGKVTARVVGVGSRAELIVCGEKRELHFRSAPAGPSCEEWRAAIASIVIDVRVDDHVRKAAAATAPPSTPR